MSMRVRYSGEFLSQPGVVWKVNILQEASSDFTVGELVFPLDPLLIAWDERSVEEPVCGSMATLRIESPGDRTYADLYTEVPGAVRLDVYRENVLYWSGCLDTETYREPYDRGANYDVELIFYDFGHLGRLPYNLTGTKTLRQILEAALTAAGINYTSINTSYTSTKFTDDSAVSLTSLTIPSENFIDEDGIAFDWETVLAGILQPLALKVIQKAGVIWVYDLNGLYRGKVTTEDIDWSSTGQEMSVGRVYNNIRVTFSPYSKAKMLPELKYGDTYGPEYTNTDHSDNNPDYYSFYQNRADVYAAGDYDYISFTIFRSNDVAKCKGLAEIGNNNRFFKIYPMMGGEEVDGVAVGFVAGHADLDYPAQCYLKGISPGTHPQTVAMKTERVYLPAMGANDRNANFVRILMEMLADSRYNPYEDGNMDNQQDDYNAFRSFGQQAFIPVDIVLYNASGTALYHYHNRGITTHGHPADSVSKCAAWSEVGDGWQSGAPSFGDAWLAFYDDALDIVTGQGCLGWKKNRQNFGKPWTEGRVESKRSAYYHDANNTKRSWAYNMTFKNLPDGQFIPYPPVGGYLEIRVYNGVYIFDDLDQFAMDGSGGFSSEGLYSRMRWLLYKAPEVSVVKRTLTFDDSEVDDIEYSGVANVNAKEDLKLETICGTSPTACPTARGILSKASDGQQISVLKRQGRTESLEQLLIGTLYSQFATRKTVLSGEVTLDPGGLTLYEDEAQEDGVKFLITGEEQNIRDNTSVATFLEVRPDEYTAE